MHPQAEDRTPRTVNCALCGVQSTLAGLFQRGKISQHRAGLLCPRCFAKQRALDGKWSIQVLCLIGAVGASLWVWGVGLSPVGLIMLSPVCGFVFTILLTPLHELAHAIMALALGMKVHKIVIGWFGKPVVRFQLGRCSVEVTDVPLGGLTYATDRSTDFIRLKLMLFIAAGPLLHIVLLAVAWSVVVGGEESDSMPGVLVWLVIVFGLANAFEIVLNLWPRRFRTHFGELASDGLALVRLPFASQDEIDQYALAYYYYESLGRLRLNDEAGAIECLQEGLHRFPADISLRSCYALVLLDQDEYDKATRIFEELRQRPELSPEADALLQNNIAWADLVSWKAERLERALDFSCQAIDALPWQPELKGTRGSVLVVSGDVENGVNLLRQAWTENEDRRNRAFNAVFLALTSARLGQPDEARDWLRKAERLDAHCRQLDRICRHVDEILKPQE